MEKIYNFLNDIVDDSDFSPKQWDFIINMYNEVKIPWLFLMEDDGVYFSRKTIEFLFRDELMNELQRTFPDRKNIDEDFDDIELIESPNKVIDKDEFLSKNRQKILTIWEKYLNKYNDFLDLA